MTSPNDRPRSVTTIPVFFSIVSANYLAYAVTLMQSLRDHHPDAPRYVVLADEDPGDVGIDPDLFTLVTVRELGLPNPEHFAFRYSILEFNTALKPFAARWLARQHPATPIVYVDPDILVVAPMDAVLGALAGGALAVVTPHLTAPLCDDKLPDELAILRVGVYNLGFIALGAHRARDALIDWWADKLEHRAYVDVDAGLFTDQSWMALIPGLFPDVVILRHPGYNLAYWNLAHRPVTQGASGQWLADGEPISFVHFSGVDPRHPRVFSIHQNRFDATTIGGLLPMYRQYLKLLDANGYERFSSLRYAWSTLRDGTPITPSMRKVFRQKLDVGRREEAADPFGLERSALEHHVSVSGRAAGAILNVYPRIKATRFVRSAMNAAPPELRFRIKRSLLKRADPGAVEDLPPRAVPALPDVDGATRSGGANRLHANLIGYLKGEFGVGEAARGFARACETSGIDLALINIDSQRTARDQDTSVTSVLGEHAPNDINFWCVNADQIRSVMATRGARIVRGRYNVGLWAWELGRFPPAWRSAAKRVDEIWVASEFERASIQAATTTPVLKIPLVVNATPSRRYSRGEFGLPDDEFVFLYTFDFGSYVARKNPTAVVRAFRAAFPTGDEPVTLMLKSTNGDRNPERLAEVVSEASGDMRLRLMDGFLSRDELYGLESVADAYVSLHRSEGFGLGMAESMWLGKPVIATAYSGNLEFMNDQNSCLVGYRLIDVGSGEYPYGEGQLWAEPDIDDAANHMRRLVADANYAGDLGRKAREYVMATLSPEAVGVRIASELERITAAM